MVHFNATRKKAVKRNFKVQYSAIFPTKTNTNKHKKNQKQKIQLVLFSQIFQ